MPSHRTVGSLVLLVAVPLLWTGAGCAKIPGFHEGGTRASDDQHTYVSRTWEPKTVWVEDTRTQEILWSIDVPVGRKLVVRFFDDQNHGDPVNPAVMRWELMDASRMYGELSNALPVPGRDARRLDWKLRPAPEYAPSAQASGG